MSADTTDLTIDKLVYGGEGLGRLPGGEVIFVPWSAPGDALSVERLPGKKKPARGAIREICTPGPQRTEPPCSVFGTCGGCQWQHITPVAQREWKRNIVAESLQRLGKLPDVPVLETIGDNDSAWHYRNRVQWDVDAAGRLGYVQAQSHAVVAFDHCWIIPDTLNRLADWLRQHFAKEPPEGIRRIEAMINRAGQMLVSLEGPPSAYHKALSQELRETMPDVIGVIHADSEEIISGDDFLKETLGGNTFHISAGSFFQTNIEAAKRICAVLDDWLVSDAASLIDLYAGVSVFALAFRNKVQRVLAVESSQTAMADAETSLGWNQALNVALMPGDARRVLRSLDEDFDIAIVDPPRAGCQSEVLDWLSHHVTRQILYVSCNPTTLARDLRALADAGWRVERVQPVDMFPQTYHIECVAELRR